MPQYPIPTDWSGTDWGCVIIEWPLSVEWFGILRGLVTTPLRGRFWDGKTGSIIDAQAIGREIEERNPVTTCEDIVIALQGIQVAVENLDVSADLQVAIQTNISNNIDLVASSVSTSLATQTGSLVAASSASASSTANAYAWSQALAQNFVGVFIQNNTESQFRPIEPGVDPPPTVAEETPTGITSVLESATSTEECKRAYWLVRNAQDFFDHLAESRNYFADTVLGIGSIAADALWVAALRSGAGSKRFLMPAAALVSLTHTLTELLFDQPGPGALELIKQFFVEEFDNVVCALADGMATQISTRDLQIGIFNALNVWGLDEQQAGLVIYFFNLSALAALYYVSPLLDPAPPLPVGVSPTICTFCGA